MKTRYQYSSIIQMMFVVVTGVALAWTQPVHAVPESDLARAFDSTVRPFIQGQLVAGSFSGTGGVTLRYRKRVVANALGTLLIVNGRTEFSTKYDELLYDLRDLPMTVFLVDHRGQGMSGRLLADTNKGHVVKFSDYIADLSIFIDTIVRKKGNGPLIIVAHSMGGLVSVLYANSRPDSVQGLILCAPMLGIKTAPMPALAARFLSRLASLLGLAEHYVPGGRPYDPGKPFSTNEVTHSEARFMLNQRLVAETPRHALGSPTFGWINQAFAGADQLTAEHRYLTMPVLLLQAGDDKVVPAAPQTEFCKGLPDCTLVPLPGSGHEILMERDAIRDRAIARIHAFVGQLISVSKSEGRS